MKSRNEGSEDQNFDEKLLQMSTVNVHALQ